MGFTGRDTYRRQRCRWSSRGRRSVDHPGRKPIGGDWISSKAFGFHQRGVSLMRQSSQNQPQELDTESVAIPGTGLRVGRVALGTWAMGGWMWGGSDERESVATIRAALGRGINLIDTAPVYGFGVSEEIVGRAVAASGMRS